MRLLNLLLTAVFVTFAATNAFASDADFVLKNKTGYQIDEVYVGPVSSKSWGKDIMGTGSLGDGEQVKIVFPHGNGACMFDLKVKYSDGSEASWSEVDLCKWEAISLFWDKAAQVTKAVGE